MPAWWLRRVRRALRPGRGRFVYHPDYRRSIPGVPLDALRGERILSFLVDRALVRRRDLSLPQPASVENLLRVHHADYLRRLDRPETVASIIGAPIGPEEARHAVELQRLEVGGTIQATRLALRFGGPVVHLGGGFHHAAPDRGMGFCIFNDVAVAIARLRARQFREPILVVDLDLHDGNGTRAAFATDPTVHTFSIHNAAWDDAPAVASTSLALGTGVGDREYLDALREALPPVIRSHRPGLVFYVAGCDPAADDALGDWRISPEGMLERDRFVLEQVRSLRGHVPVVVVLGGGYGGAAWRYSARFFGWMLDGRVVEPPDELGAALLRRRWIGALLGEAEPPGGRDWLDWSLSEEDIGLAPAPSETRLLGRFTARDVERQLEEFGIFGQLRAQGYAAPVLELEPSSGLGETLRVYGDERRRELLVEIRMNRSRALVPGMELLVVEWLLLQNPRARFHPGRPPLPGQEHPGLGIFADIVAWLTTVCREAGLEGIGFRSSHFHIAALGRRYLRFLRPADEACFEALCRATDGLDLRDAATAIAEGRVVDRRTGEPVRWADVPMVLPVGRRLRESIEATRAAAPGPPAPPEYRLIDSADDDAEPGPR